jgi:hypothetical protein
VHNLIHTRKQQRQMRKQHLQNMACPTRLKCQAPTGDEVLQQRWCSCYGFSARIPVMDMECRHMPFLGRVQGCNLHHASPRRGDDTDQQT